MPLDKRSTGFTSVGQYLQLALGRFVCISVTWFHTKVGSCLVLLTQCSTIWLSDQINIGGSCNGRCVITKCVSLVAISAVISSRRGSVRCFSGVARVFSNTNETWLLSVYKEDDSSIGLLACISKAVDNRLCGRSWEVASLDREL